MHCFAVQVLPGPHTYLSFNGSSPANSINGFTLRSSASRFKSCRAHKPNPPSKVSHLLTRSTALRCEAVLRGSSPAGPTNLILPQRLLTRHVDQRHYVAQQRLAVQVLPGPQT